ncbi:MAG: hypothetical protein K9I69_05445 [Ignavibacteriales bacterium]|nr:hypothetical protein [Ignavibacteriales bacterium]MCF8305424.1 hypothetical protein [Ignavibacteriales bacterium]MCF8316107.1 hypothetical protein [Ignavibacteriales bacterium]MCF8436609.1 hypothetical protein [Ignavibacteriales bacterium]
MKYQLKTVLAILVAAVSFSAILSAQEKDKSLQEKLKELKGKVESITIKTDSERLELKGEEAEGAIKILSRKFPPFHEMIFSDDEAEGRHVFVFSDSLEGKLKKKMKKIIINGDEDEIIWDAKDKSKKGRVFFFSDSSGDNIQLDNKRIKVMVTDDDEFSWTTADSDSGTVKKEVNIEINGGVKKLTIKTTKDGKTEEKVYEGEEADKMIQELESGKDMKFDIKIDDETGKEKTVIIKKMKIKED